ncbi:MAG: 3-dehydroquinate synthase [Oscillospiraceae bacterium]|nr:3-dehydroquinate synthase [Oscillospiraceae bacterium]
MQTLTVALPGREYDIFIESGLLDRAGAYCRTVLPRAGRVVVVTDSNVAPLYAKRVTASLEGAGFAAGLTVIPAGESSKSVTMLERLYDDLMDFGLTRSDAVLALGGGVVGDLAGFAAATILRGVDLIQMPTTLLAQVDSSVGGKVAVDLKAGKNLAGAFWQPKLVLMDPDCLTTLDDKTFADGMAEVIKYGCIWDERFCEFLLSLGGREGVMTQIDGILAACCDVKRQVVERDERDTGLRMILNFGHTLGHAYELFGKYETYTHGQAVAAGMCRAADIGVRLGITPAGVPEAIAALLCMYGLPTAIDCGMAHYEAAVGLDKKGDGGDISLILLTKLGKAEAVKLPKSEVLHLLEAFSL